MYVQRNPDTNFFLSNNPLLNLLCLNRTYRRGQSTLSITFSASLIVALFGLSVGANYSVDMQMVCLPFILDVS